MMLAVRMFLYLVFGALAGQGLVVFDQTAGTVTFRVEDLMLIVTGLAGYLGTFVASRFAKVR
jgi:hypothetical protein